MMAVDPQQVTYQYVQEDASLLFFQMTLGGQITTANQYARTIVGQPLQGRYFRDLIVDFSGSFDLDSLLCSATRAHLLTLETVTGLPQSYYFHFVKLTSGLLAYGGYDVEELELMRREILSLNQDLNNLTRQLHQKNAQLQHLNREKNQFLGMAAHDLRKPIGLISAYTEFLQDEAAEVLDSEQNTFLERICSACTFMQRLVDDFLDISAIEAGKFEVKRQSVPIHDLLTQCLVLNHLQARKKRVELQVHYEDPIPDLMVDPSKLEQAITNLVSNAVEHSPSGASVTISLTHDGQQLTCAIQDRGAGIAETERHKLFQPFGKTSARKTGREKSTGLGLLITRKIIEAHGGRIWVDSQVGQGTTVHFSLPSGDQLQ